MQAPETEETNAPVPAQEFLSWEWVSLPPDVEWFIPAEDVEFAPEPFASGSLGAAYRGKWQSRDVVVKTLVVDDWEFMDKWYKLQHPNIVTLYGACHVTSRPFIVCEAATHGNVADYLAKAPTRSHRHLMWRFLLDAARGLEYLHTHDIVHGNLKLSNMLVRSDGNVELTDIGLLSVGAVRWRAPECVRGDEPTFASDVYSLGMRIIEAATGSPPFAFVPDEIVSQAVGDGSLPDQPADLDDSAWALVYAMTRLEPTERCKLGFVITTLVRFAGDSIDDEGEAEANCQPSSIYSMTATVASLSLGTHAFDRYFHATKRINADLGALLEAIRDGVPGEREGALQVVYRRTFDRLNHSDILAHGGFELLSRIASDQWIGFESQLYAFGCVRNLWSKLATDGSIVYSTPSVELRDATSFEYDQLRQSLAAECLSANERLEAMEVLTLLHYAKPSIRGLSACVREVVGLLCSDSVVLSTSAVRAVIALSEDSEAASAVVQHGAISALVDLVLLGEHYQRFEAVRALGHLARTSVEHQDAIAKSGVIDVLLDFVFSGSGNKRVAGCFALCQVVKNHEINAILTIQHGNLHTFLADEKQQDEELSALWTILQPYAKAANGPSAVRRYEVLDSCASVTDIVAVIRFASGDELTEALRRLYAVVNNLRTHDAIFKSNGVASLAKAAILQSSTVEQRLYAYGCLMQLELEPMWRERLQQRFVEPADAVVHRLWETIEAAETDLQRLWGPPSRCRRTNRVQKRWT